MGLTEDALRCSVFIALELECDLNVLVNEELLRLGLSLNNHLGVGSLEKGARCGQDLVFELRVGRTARSPHLSSFEQFGAEFLRFLAHPPSRFHDKWQKLFLQLLLVKMGKVSRQISPFRNSAKNVSRSSRPFLIYSRRKLCLEGAGYRTIDVEGLTVFEPSLDLDVSRAVLLGRSPRSRRRLWRTVRSPPQAHTRA